MTKFLGLVLVLFSSGAFAELQTVDYVDPSRYIGTWYQIARNPIFFENGCVCSRQVLEVVDANTLSVYNSCNLNNSPKGPISDIRGTATNDDPKSNSKFTVDFGLPAKGKYWIIGLDAEYRYAVVSDPSERSLYVLSKTPQLDGKLYNQAVLEASEKTDTSKLVLTSQEGCTYPSFF